MSKDPVRVVIWTALVLFVVGSVSWTLLTRERDDPGTPARDHVPINSVRWDEALTDHEDVEGYIPLSVFHDILAGDAVEYRAAMEQIERDWQLHDTAVLLEVSRFLGYPSERRTEVFEMLERVTGEPLSDDLDRWWEWLWARDYTPRSDYGLFKAAIYSHIDQRFAAYFDDHTDNARIRLDEVRWGGVRRNGIPPLRSPEMIRVEQAGYLADDHVVFGIEINGDARAYPKRILAWHEMFTDTVGGVSVNGVYCTLCGSMILYNTVVDGAHHELGTSGFLYRSNKVMFDEATESMWSTITGEPVIGPLVGQGIKLEPLYVVTTTWGQWRRQHPDTTVLSLNTGHRRDYNEGAAYSSYFATDELMFTVPQTDDRLLNKDEVLALRFGGPSATPTVIAADFLASRSVYEGTLGDTRYVVLTDPSGANRVYDRGGVTFTGYAGQTAEDSDGGRWTVHEDALVLDDGTQLPRLPAHRAFWFGWYAAHPDSVLIQ